MTTLITISVKLPKSDVSRIPARNRSAFIREAVREKLVRKGQRWKPKTAFGKRLLALRAARIRRGSRLFTAEEIDAEIRERRGSMG